MVRRGPQKDHEEADGRIGAAAAAAAAEEHRQEEEKEEEEEERGARRRVLTPRPKTTVLEDQVTGTGTG
ncbi:hypothetical protein AXG93_1712s1640 [Marchantia polymorpha subsp. ruderalis]|uniref:Uncharacterized protein n=1 Tax=Marchantia polymorpha subsp. ruderalis TaxID=1480154 RepID=A0A176VYV7_MARPO|nr:hypothetical protein AXG93_1712s1640 [Marchantia polymorpha subsp. ruderalis]